MNKILSVLTAVAALSSTAAFAANEDLKPLGLSPACETTMINKIVATCNKDSKGDKSREHGCLYSELNILRNQSTEAYFEVNFTVTDADVYAYGVSISDKSKCTFKVTAKN